MAYPRKIRNFNAFVDGIGYAGRVTEGMAPVMKIKGEEHRGAGMDAPVTVDMGMEALTTSLTFVEYLPALLKMVGTRQSIVLRPAQMGEADFETDTIIHTCRGRVMSVDPGTLKAGDETSLKLEMATDYYKLEMNGETLIDIDVENGVRIIDGVDQLAGIRAAMGF
ncbi:MAG: phage major tail tube protein [Pseudomonadota bacterium]